MPVSRCLGSLGIVARVVVGLSLIGVFGLLRAAPAEAAAGGTLIIHARVCPTAYPHNFFNDCHGNPPGSTLVTFTVAGRSPRAVSAVTGNIKYLNLAAGDRTVTQIEGPPGDFTGRRVFCSINGGAAYEVASNLPTFSAPIQAGRTTTCDYYITILPT